MDKALEQGTFDLFEAAFSEMEESLCLADASHTIQRASKKFCELLSCNPETLQGKSLESLFPDYDFNALLFHLDGKKENPETFSTWIQHNPDIKDLVYFKIKSLFGKGFLLYAEKRPSLLFPHRKILESVQKLEFLNPGIRVGKILCSRNGKIKKFETCSHNCLNLNEGDSIIKKFSSLSESPLDFVFSHLMSNPERAIVRFEIQIAGELQNCEMTCQHHEKNDDYEFNFCAYPETAEIYHFLSKTLNFIDFITSSVPMSLEIIDENFDFCFVNENFANFFHKTPEEMIGKKGSEMALLNDSRLNHFHDYNVKVMETNQPVFVPRFCHKINGVEYTQQLAKFPLSLLNGKKGVITFALDITRLIEAEQKSEAVYQNLPGGSFLTNVDSVILNANESFCRLSGYTSEDLVGRDYHLFFEFPDEDYDKTKPQRVILKTKAGKKIPILKNQSRISFGGQEYLLANFQDLSLIEEAGKKLIESEKEKKAILESFSDSAIVYYDSPALHVKWRNEQLEKVWGVKKEDFERKKCYEAIFGRDEVCEDCPVIYAFQNKKNSEFLQISHNLRTFLCSAYPVFGDESDVSGVVLYCKDVTPRIQMEEELKSANDFLAKLIQRSPAAVVVLNESGKVEVWNPAAEKIFGYQAKSVVGRHFPAFTPEETASLNQKMKSYLEQEKSHGIEVDYGSGDQTKNLLLFPAYLSKEKKILKKILLIYLDRTNWVAAQKEKEKMRDQLYQIQKMDSIGTLAGGIAHDFNNLLTIIKGYAEMLMMSPLQEEAKDDVREILEAAKRAASLTEQLLTFSRQSEEKRELIDLSKSVEELSGMIKRIIGENIIVEMDLYHGLPFISADKTNIVQTLLNLVSNARDAMPNGGKLSVRTGLCQRKINGDVPKEFVFLKVSDNGEGIPPDHLNKIFEPFFTTKPQGKGTGLGLSMVYGIVSQLSGQVEVQSDEGIGSLFTLFFPVYKAENQKETQSTEEEEKVGRGEAVLIVEDNTHVLRYIDSFLRSQGLRTFTAQDAGEAFHQLKKNPKIRLILSDVIMPGMSGIELAKDVRESYPEMKIILYSGYSKDLVDYEEITEEGIPVLSKPLETPILIESIKKALD